MIRIGKNLAFGTAAPLPLKGFPSGKYRIRLRTNELVKVYVKNEDGIREFAVEATDGYWTPYLELARNIRGQNDQDPQIQAQRPFALDPNGNSTLPTAHD